MKLILAQGNPGVTYDGTRHNVGFAVLDRLAAKYGTAFKEKAKFHALAAELTVDGEKAIMIKPTTFYNETGRAARALADFYKLDPVDILVVHDELALPFGTVRTRTGGSDAGNNGIKSLNAALGQDYRRVRIGIFNDNPGLGKHQIDEAGFVLGKFTKPESDALVGITDHVLSLITAFIDGTMIDETTKL